MAAVQYPFERGLEKEMEFAAVLFQSGQARALQYAFFAQRAATKVWSCNLKCSIYTVDLI